MWLAVSSIYREDGMNMKFISIANMFKYSF